MDAAIAESGAVVLTGSAGVGKSRLAHEFVGRSRYRIARWIAATQTGRSVPLGALAEFAADCGPDPLRRVQEIIEALTGDEVPMAVLVCVDDVHLLDEQSAAVISQLVKDRIAPVLMTVRDGHAVPDTIASLWGSARPPRIEIPALTAAEVTSLLEQVLDGPLESSSAQRFWSYTRGNALYLRQLIADEIAAGRLTQRYGVWVWDGAPRLSPLLVDLIGSSIGRLEDSVIDVLDVLAVCDPVEVPVLHSLLGTSGLEAAVTHGFVTVDPAAGLVHLTHPLFGEVRRDQAGTARLRHLRGRVADAIGALPSQSPVQLVRRGVLVMDADGSRDPELLRTAAEAALQLLDLDLAIELSGGAVQAGGGRAAQLTHALALGMAGGGSGCDDMLAALMATADDGELAQIALMRAAILTWNVGNPHAAEAVLDEVSDAAAACGLAPSCDALRASIWAQLGRPSEAVDLAATASSSNALQPLAAMFGCWAAVIGYGDLGRIDQLREAAARGYELALSAPEASQLRFSLGLMEMAGLRLVGALESLRAVAARLRGQSQDIDVSHAFTAMLMGLAELSCGHLVSAQRWFRESLARVVKFPDLSVSVCELSGLWLTTALAMSGDRLTAQQTYDKTLRTFDGEVVLWQSESRLAQAWLHSVNGSVSLATTFAIAAARAARKHGRTAHEVFCLQAATQFGSTNTADRLRELASTVQGPRVGAAYAHAKALRKADGPGLVAASNLYEEFGDRVAAVDAAAQAAVVLDRRGLHSASNAAASRARRLAAETGADTMTFRAMTCSAVLTRRQREVIALAASGLSNREIAARLVTSVRTVEGHLFRACQRTGTNTRDELIAWLQRAAPERL
ncbi:transcriptional regulator [Mycolicibacterium pulveris]|uniref:Transcriptional regulator n=2 Tax=Mycolicibacterium pulveris TaxID=36813 RepID=A0A7I7UTJ9_MYCPV|nr:transcriptional regulator [Mycolicibacterium pulveris]